MCLANLGGHDLAEFIDVLEQAKQTEGKPTIIFAYTVKGWGLPIAGHPLNHSMLLSAAQMEQLRKRLTLVKAKNGLTSLPIHGQASFVARPPSGLMPLLHHRSTSPQPMLCRNI